MSKFYRIIIIFAVVATVAIMIMYQVGQASGNNPAPSQNRSAEANIQSLQPVQATSQPTQAPPAQSQPQQAPAQTTPSQAKGLVWNDVNQDGVQSLSEKGFANIVVNLFSANKEWLGTASTNSNGAYEFTNLAPGNYFIGIIIPDGFFLSPSDKGVNELVDNDIDQTILETKLTTLLPGDNGLVWTVGIYSPTEALQEEPGTVQPPVTDLLICAPGIYPLGGISTLRVAKLDGNYCLHAFLWNNGFEIARILDNAGSILSETTFIEVYRQNSFVNKYDVTGETDSIQICYAVPVGQQAQLYFFNYYGPTFRTQSSQLIWELLPTTTTNGIACAVAQTSGAYALIGN